MGIENTPNNEQGWWHNLPDDQKIMVNLVGKYDHAGLSALTSEAKRREAVRRSYAAINNIMNFVLDNIELFPSVAGYEDFDILDMLHSVFLELTPTEIELIHQSGVTSHITPDAEFYVELLKRRDQ